MLTRESVGYHRARLSYQYNKLEAIRKGIYPRFGGNVEFELFAFFEVCYHLKDWIKNSPEYDPLKDKKVEEFVKASPALRICADVCNRLKHRRLDRAKSKSPLGPFQLKTTITVGTDPRAALVSLDEAVVETERGGECCYALAKECMSEWERYFSP